MKIYKICNNVNKYSIAILSLWQRLTDKNFPNDNIKRIDSGRKTVKGKTGFQGLRKIDHIILMIRLHPIIKFSSYHCS